MIFYRIIQHYKKLNVRSSELLLTKKYFKNMRLKIFAILSVLFFAANLSFGQANWTTDYETSLAKAKMEKKPVLLLFTGSDWCPPCKRLHRVIFDSKEFEEYSKDNLILILADFPKRKEHRLPAEQRIKNEKLARKYGVRGFPTTLILDTDGEEIDRRVGYSGITPKQYIERIKEISKSIK